MGRNKAGERVGGEREREGERVGGREREGERVGDERAAAERSLTPPW